MQPDVIFGLVVLVVSIVLHEVAHGYMANWLGDPTARLQGRLTLNPVGHVDPVGTFLLPFILWAAQGFSASPLLIGYAKPVPYNPYNLRGKYGEGLVAFAGPGTNLLIALIFSLVVRFGGAGLPLELASAFVTIIFINLVLALFNLIPIPPLDGSKVLSALLLAVSRPLARGYDTFRLNFEQLGMVSGTLLILAFFYLFRDSFAAVVWFFFRLLTGI